MAFIGSASVLPVGCSHDASHGRIPDYETYGDHRRKTPLASQS